MAEHDRKTENHKADNGKIQRELNKFSNAINQTADSVMITDKDGTIEYVNPAFEMLTGYTIDEAVGQTPRILNSGKHEQGFYDNLWSTILSGKVLRKEFINKSKHGKLYYQAETITPVIDEIGNVTSFVSTGRDITEHKRLDKILRERESEKRFRIMADTAPVMIWMADPNKGFNFFNKGWLDYTGRTMNQEIGDGWTANIHPEDFKRFLEKYSSAFDTQQEFRIEYRHRRSDDKYRWILNTGVPRFINDGGFVGYIGSCIDITERKQAEETIQSIVEKHPDGILVVDMDGIVRFTNRSAEFIFEHTGKKLTGAMLGHPLTANDMTEIGIIRKTGEHGIAEMRKDSTEWEGKPALLVSIRDITERKKVEEALRISEANLAEAQRIGHMGNVEWDIVNDKVYLSEEVYQIYGLKPEDFDNNYQAYKTTVHPDDREFYEKSINEALYENKLHMIDHRIIRPDGAERIVHKHAVVTFDDADKPIRMFGTVHDITERKKREEELLKTQKLESIGVLAGGIAHDFNNILTSILGNANLAMINSKENDKIYKNLVNVEKATIRAKDLTQQLLTFSKGGAPIKKIISIAGLIKDAAGFALRGGNVKCKFIISADLWPVNVDEGQLNQVINNLVINSIQAMPKGGKIDINAENISKSDSKEIPSLERDRYVKISVKDYGVGIQKEHLANIFDPYFTTKQTGSGLGLASSYSIIKNHGGIITVASELSVGTTFCIYLQACSKEITKKKEEEYAPPTGKGKVLIMDDDDDIRDMGKEILSFVGYEVECAKDGVEAIELYKAARETSKAFDVVVMDLTIPGGMGGKEAIKKLREIDSEAKAIVFSGYSNDPIMADFEKYGFNGVITKPFDIRKINELLHKVMEG